MAELWLVLSTLPLIDAIWTMEDKIENYQNGVMLYMVWDAQMISYFLAHASVSGIMPLNLPRGSTMH